MRQPPPGAVPPAAPKKSPADPPYDPAALMARVGTEVVQANEVLPVVHQHIERMVKEHAEAFNQLPPDVKKEQLENLERQTMKQVVEDSIKIKLLLTEVRSKAPPEGLKKNEEKIRTEFNQNYIGRLKTQYKVASIIELEDKLRSYGSSLNAQRTMYVEQVLAYSWLQQQIKDQKPPTHEEMLTFYKDHLADWESPARATVGTLDGEVHQLRVKGGSLPGVGAVGQRGVARSAVCRRGQGPLASPIGRGGGTQRLDHPRFATFREVGRGAVHLARGHAEPDFGR